MPVNKKVDRRTAIKGVAVGMGAVSSLPILNNLASAQAHQHHAVAPKVAENCCEGAGFL
jgi:hypothetical protein